MMTPGEKEELANLVCDKLKAHQEAFYIKAEAHYQDHMNMREMYTEFKAVKGMFMKAFIGFAIVGTFVLAFLGSGMANLSRLIK